MTNNLKIIAIFIVVISQFLSCDVSGPLNAFQKSTTF